MKRTIIVANGTAANALRLQLARKSEHGVDVRTIEQVGERLAGGFLRVVDADTLAKAAADAVGTTSPADLGDLSMIADLPGLPGALATTLSRAWLADIDLAVEAASRPEIPRLTALAALERAVLDRLPRAMLRPSEIADRAIARLHHADRVLGPVELDALLDVAPCWRRLLIALDRHAKLQWRGGAPTPSWWTEAGMAVAGTPAGKPSVQALTCATARHEVIEAMRWARGLLASGNVQAGEIAFAAASPGEYDDLVLAISREASLDIHFAHGRKALATRDGQQTAALADILLHGLSQDRVRRLARLAHAPGTPFGQLPDDWAQTLPPAAPLSTQERWRQTAAATNLAVEITAVLLPAIDLLAAGTQAASEAGEIFLRGTARLLWRRALDRAPASALETSLGTLRLPDPAEPATSIMWSHAAVLACCPRPYVWLFGLNARTWPRAASEDPLLPDHIIPADRLDPVPITRADRLAFAAIQATTARELVCCASRRDATGRLLGMSPLMPAGTEPTRLARARIPEHAMSEQDRLMARPAEFATTPRAISADAAWQDWNSADITPHDGLVRPGHPVLQRALERVHSATSLRKLLRSPIGFAWEYALGWREPDSGIEAMELDAMQFGGLVHDLLETALPHIEAAGGLSNIAPGQVATIVHTAREGVAAQWEATAAVPPALLWQTTLERAERMAVTALTLTLPDMAVGRSYGEVPFGEQVTTAPDLPWDSSAAVTIPGTDLRIRGFIDRLDLSPDGRRARVVDYKTGRLRDPGVLDGGKELQRCLYAAAVRAMLGDGIEVEAALLFPLGEGAYHPLPDAEAALETLTQALLVARESLLAGRALPGRDTGGDYDVMAFALPASPGAMTERKREAAEALLGDAALIWEQP